MTGKFAAEDFTIRGITTSDSPAAHLLGHVEGSGGGTGAEADLDAEPAC